MLALIIVMILDRRLDYFTWLGREEHSFIIVVDVLVIYALTVHGGELRSSSR